MRTILSEALEKSWIIEEGRGAIIILEVRCVARYSLAAEGNNLGDFRIDDHDGEVGIRITKLTNSESCD